LGNGWPELALITIPVILPVCAKAVVQIFMSKLIIKIKRMKTVFFKGKIILYY
jgi:hypothetical protein